MTSSTSPPRAETDAANESPEKLRQRILRPYLPLLHDWLKHDLDSAEIPQSAELEGRCVMLGEWEQRQLKVFRRAPAFGLKPEASLVLEGIAFQFTAHRLEQCFESGPMPEPSELPQFLDDIVAQLAAGIALEDLLQKSVDSHVQQGGLTEAKQVSEFRIRIAQQLTELKNRVGAVELDRAVEIAPALVAVQVRKTRSADPECEDDVLRRIRKLEEQDEPGPSWASLGDEESRKEEKLPPWLHEKLTKPERPPRPALVTDARVKPLLIVLAALIVVYALVIWPRVRTEGPPTLTAMDFGGFEAVQGVRARPPSLFIVVDAVKWDETAAEQQVEMVEAMGAVADQAGYSGILIRADEGRVVADWLKNTGVAIRQQSGGAS